MSQVSIGGIPFDDVGFQGAIDLVVRWAGAREGGYICTPNVDYVVRARRDPAFRAAVLGAKLRVPDGMGVIYGSRIRGTPLTETVTGRLLPEAVSARLAGLDASVALFGGRPGAASTAALRLRSLGASVAATVVPAMGFEIGTHEDDACVDALASSGAAVIFVGLGAPKQELWMAHHASRFPNSVLIGVGQGIDVLGKLSRAAPVWMTRVGLEWAFRLLHQPRRLAKRYLWDDPRFFAWMLAERVQTRRGAKTL